MSVQVKRRRESAAFLAGYVGAQGELLVDTTNNRVQVHDGAAPGGWPAASIADLPGRNTIINGTFPINQRNYVSGATLAAGAYAHDRWKAGSGGCTYNFTSAIPDTVITISAGTIVQAVDAPNVFASTYWLTWTGTAQARVWQSSATGPLSADTISVVAGIPVNVLPVTGLTIGTIANIEFGTGTLGLVQFEGALPNAGPTRFERRQFGAELGLCLRYFQRWQQPPLRGGCTGSSTIGRAGMALPTQMRAAPTAILTGTLSGNVPGIAIVNVTAIAANYSTTIAMEFDLALAQTSGSAGQAFQIIQSGSGYVDMIAEL